MIHPHNLRFILAFMTVVANTALAGTLDDIRSREELICGIDGDLLGFSKPSNTGEMEGIDADICYALAAAVFAGPDPKKYVRFVPLNPDERFNFLREGKIDVLSRNSTHTLERDSKDINFTHYNYIDSQGFMIRKSMNIKSAKQLNNVDVCVQRGTTTELNLDDFFQENGKSYEKKLFTTTKQTWQGFDRGECDVVTADRSQLAAMRIEIVEDKSSITSHDLIILPEAISKEPLGPVVRGNDDEWMDIVSWTIYAMINADELNITSKNVDDMKKSKNAKIKRLLGTEVDEDMGQYLGLSRDWVVRILKHVGNYDEIYQRNIYDKLGLERAGSVNALWEKGGIVYAPPVR